MTRRRAEFSFALALGLIPLMFVFASTANGQDGGEPKPSDQTAETADSDSKLLSLEELKAAGARASSYRNQQRIDQKSADLAAPEARLAAFHKDVKPVLETTCVQCHGADLQEGNVRIDTLDPDLFHGNDVEWWLEVLAVLSNGEMPPVDEAELADEDRRKVMDWLSSELQVASAARRAEEGHSAFRRMTRYEYNYALQDLLGLPYDFAKDLPPESTSEDGFQNSSDLLHMSVMQLDTYRTSARNALSRATIQGEQPQPIYWGISMKDASANAWKMQQADLDRIGEEHKDDPEKMKEVVERKEKEWLVRPNQVHYKILSTDRTSRASWNYHNAKYAHSPSPTAPEVPAEFDCVAIIPRGQKLIIELGDRVPDAGNLRVRVRASQTGEPDSTPPSLQLEFGWQASNDSSASVRISECDQAVEAVENEPAFYEWSIPLSDIYPRNSVRNISQMGDLPSPSEFLKLINSSVSQGDIQIDYIEVTSPVYEIWPPESHQRIFTKSKHSGDELAYAREILSRFMSRAWRREVSNSEIEQKLDLFEKVRPTCDDFQQAIIEVLASVLSSSKFLYLARPVGDEPVASQVARSRLGSDELATRLSMFLWCSTPDEELLNLVKPGERQADLVDPEVLSAQTKRMLADPRSRRFSKHFMRQWLGMQLLDYLDVDRKEYRQFDSALKDAMQEEPIAFFQEVLNDNRSVLEFIHADYTLANERLARHYGLDGVYGNEFRRVALEPDQRRGGLLTQAGFLAMNSDGKDSHPLKRGIWLLERLLNDPPPPPPPAVPEIDLADPEIAKLTLKERIEDHRNQPACMSCHAKIDPWGIAFENFDAVGAWREEINGRSVDASSRLFNGQPLVGMDGLKRFLLENRQDQFVRAMVHKLTTYALGRPLTFADRSSVEQITADVRKQDDGLATMIKSIVASELFQTR